MQNSLRPLPLGRSSFSALRKSGALYVDKTEQIARLCRDDAMIFLARPRRFGKSLLVSTFASLFRHGLRDFEGLSIARTWKDSVYRTLHLDFSLLRGSRSSLDFSRSFEALLEEAFSPIGFRYQNGRTTFFTQLDAWLGTLPVRSLVLLIDEYDAPLTELLDQPQRFADVRDEMSVFFGLLKSNNSAFRFFFMTGITKFSNTGIFSAFNNLDDISLNSDYGTLLGYTESEIHDDFAPYVVRASQKLKLPAEQIYSQLKENYDGFCFDRFASTHVYCPWSVLSFLNSPTQGFVNYWYQSGGRPQVLEKYLVNHALSDLSAYDQKVVLAVDELSAARQYNDVSPTALLTQTGYLSIKSRLSDRYLEVGYPNREVAVSMGRLYADMLLNSAEQSRIGIPYLQRTLSEGSIEEAVAIFNRAFESLDYQRYSISDESSCRSFLQMLLIGSDIDVMVEKHSAHGRSDLEATVGRRHWVFEIKFARSKGEVQSLLEKGAVQMKDRRYGEASRETELIRAVLVFSGADRRFAAFKVVDTVR